MRRDCYFCHMSTVEKLLEKFNPEKSTEDKLFMEISFFLQQNWRLSNPLLATHIQRIAKKHIEIDDLYDQEKRSANQLLLETYEQWEKVISTSNNSFYTALKLAIIGNIIDYGAHSVPKELEQFIHDKLKVPLAIDHSEIFKNAINNAKSIVYLGDNAGEIVFDKLFIRTINHSNLTYIVRDKPVLNDVTLNDAKMVGIDSHCNVISNGSDAPSTLLHLCSDEFIQLFESADLVISKGQGNFEGLIDNSKKQLFFLLMAKCAPISQMLQVKKGSMVIKKNNNSKIV